MTLARIPLCSSCAKKLNKATAAHRTTRQPNGLRVFRLYCPDCVPEDADIGTNEPRMSPATPLAPS